MARRGSRSSAGAAHRDDSFRHLALFYTGIDDFVGRISAFLREGIAAGEAALVVVSAERIRLLREALGRDADEVRFEDMAAVGANPARIIPAWRDFVDDRSRAGQRLRGVGEPIWAGRGPAELVECQRHESLLNVAFAGGSAWSLVCPYDTETLGDDVLEEARRSHPLVVNGRSPSVSASYGGLEAFRAPFGEPLPEPSVRPRELAFAAGPLDAVRDLVTEHALTAGLGQTRTGELVLAVHELATNSIRHGGGQGLLRVWTETDAVVCEVRDRGFIEPPLAGRERPDVGEPGGRGLWLANQLCDLVQIRSSGSGSVVRVHMRRQ